MARLWLLMIAICLAPALGAYADEADEEEPDYARPGLYLRGAAQLALTTSDGTFPFAPPVEWQPDFGVDFALGWRNSERLALEAELEWITSRDGIGFGSWLAGVNGKFYFLEDAIQPYLVMGANGFWTSIPGGGDANVDWGFRHGLGADFYLDEHWALNTEWSFIWGVGDVWETYLMTFGVGLMYRY